jgi:hypothetical protein
MSLLPLRILGVSGMYGCKGIIPIFFLFEILFSVLLSRLTLVIFWLILIRITINIYKIFNHLQETPPNELSNNSDAFIIHK